MLLSVMLLCAATGLHAQNTGVDIRTDWVGVVPTIDMSRLDTIVLYPYRGVYDHSKDVFLWNYKGNGDFQLKVYNGSTTGITDPYVFAPEKWKLKEINSSELYLLVREHKAGTIFNKKVGGYKVYLYRDNYNLLTHIMMVKVYDYRYSRQVKVPIGQ